MIAKDDLPCLIGKGKIDLDESMDIILIAEMISKLKNDYYIFYYNRKKIHICINHFNFYLSISCFKERIKGRERRGMWNEELLL